MKGSTDSREPNSWLPVILVCLGLLELTFAMLAARVVSREITYPLYLAFYFAMGLPWLSACFLVFREDRDDRTQRLVVVAFALAFRATFLVTEPLLSDDIFRYVWDGRVQHAGINPYVHAPEDPELAFLRDEDYPGINNKDIPTIYPPLMEMAFFLATTVSERIVWMKAFFTLADVLLVFVLFGLLRSLGKNPIHVLAYAWCPLPVVEIAGSGHNDVLAVLCLMAAHWALVTHRDVASMALLTLSGLGKLVGFALSPLFIRWVRPRTLLVMPLLTVVFCLPYVTAGELAFRGLTQYGLRWRGNDSLFHILFSLTGSLNIAKGIVAASLVILVLVLVARRQSPLRASYITVGAILLLMTTVHPWYLLWIAPFLAIYPSPAWLLLMLTAGLGYHSAYLATPGQAWEDAVWVKLLEYGPFFALLLMRYTRRHDTGERARHPRPHPEW